MRYLENKKSSKNIRYFYTKPFFWHYINRRLDYIFISNKLQEFSNDTGVIPAFKTNHSSVLITSSNYNFFKTGPGLWKFNNSLIQALQHRGGRGGVAEEAIAPSFFAKQFFFAQNTQRKKFRIYMNAKPSTCFSGAIHVSHL